MTSRSLKQEARRSLLQYYSSKCTAHGTNILTIAIGFFASTQILDYLSPLNLNLVVIDESVLLRILISFFGGLLSHQVIRLLYWAILTEKAIHVPFLRKSNGKLSDTLNGNLLDTLNDLVLHHFKHAPNRGPRERFLASVHGYEFPFAIIVGSILFIIQMGFQMPTQPTG